MALPRRSAPTRTVLTSLGVLAAVTALDAGPGVASTAWAVSTAEASKHGGHPLRRDSDPYAGAGMLLRLPDGGQVRLVRPERSTAAAAESARPRAGRSGGSAQNPPNAPANGNPTGAGPETGGSAASGDGPGAAESDFPVPLVQPLFPGGAGSAAADAAAAGSVGGGGGSAARGSAAKAGARGSSRATADSDAARSARADHGRSAAQQAAQRAAEQAAEQARGRSEDQAQDQAEAEVWPPAPPGPPPLDPSALAGPQPGYLALPPAGPSNYGRTLRRPLLPLGVGLALIGAGAGLLGWRLRRL